MILIAKAYYSPHYRTRDLASVLHRGETHFEFVYLTVLRPRRRRRRYFLDRDGRALHFLIAVSALRRAVRQSLAV